MAEGCQFRSATDTEVVAHLIADCLKRQAGSPADPKTLVAAVQSALAQLQGTYGLAILFRDNPEVIVAARLGSPLVVGLGAGEHFLADDVIEIPAVAEYLQPIVSVVPLQLLAYHIALARGCDVDKPRNLAKSVTVE